MRKVIFVVFYVSMVWLMAGCSSAMAGQIVTHENMAAVTSDVGIMITCTKEDFDKPFPYNGLYVRFFVMVMPESGDTDAEIALHICGVMAELLEKQMGYKVYDAFYPYVAANLMTKVKPGKPLGGVMFISAMSVGR